jgi:hypothetical protein
LTASGWTNLHETGTDEPVQAGSQHVVGCPAVFRKVLEAIRASEHHVSKDQQAPAVTDSLEGSLGRETVTLRIVRKVGSPDRR